jgi:septal ring factor EnvC (AmiA/AmiB activator)
MRDILHHSGTDPATKKQIEMEREAWRTVDAMIENERKAFQKALNEKDEALSEKDKLIEELKKKLKEK